jgi:4-amino-4-deoxy-L-arabinose transferase-like glycosyltransferase
LFSSSARQVILLAVATLVPRVLLATVLGVGGEPQRWEYDVTAAHIAAGNGHVYERFDFVYAAYAPPLWSFVLAVLLRLFGPSGAAIQAIQGLFCFGAALACGRLANHITGDARAGLLAGILAALQPSLVYYSVMKSDPLPLNVLLLGWIAVSAISVTEAPDDRRAAAFGLLVGLGVLSRGTPVVALPLVAGFLVVRRRRAAWGPLAAATLAFGLCIAPWLVRNALLLGTPVITSTAAENFWRGNHAGAGGGVKDLDGGEISWLRSTNPALPESIRNVLAAGTEADRHRIFMSEAWRFIRTEPIAAMGLFVTKMRIFWWRIDSDPGEYPPMASITYEALYRAELFLAILGAFALFRPRAGVPPSPDRAAAALALVLIVLVGILQSAFYVQGRHRFMIEPLLLVFTAIGIRILVRGGWRRNAAGS